MRSGIFSGSHNMLENYVKITNETNTQIYEERIWKKIPYNTNMTNNNAQYNYI